MTPDRIKGHFRWTGRASDLRPLERLCTCCHAHLKGRIAWLEFDQRLDANGPYHDFGDVPENQSQGWFPFGLTCARNQRAKAIAARARAVADPEGDYADSAAWKAHR